MKIPIIGTGAAVHDVLITMDRFPQEDRTAYVTDMKSQGGGMVATALVAVSRLGINCAYFGNLGNDEVGQKILQGLNDEGVNTDGVELLDGYHNTVTHVLINSQTKSRTFVARKDSVPDVELTAVRKGLIDNADIIHLDGFHYDGDVEVARYAREKGLVLSYDASSIRKDPENNMQFLSLMDIVITSDRYPFAACGRETLEENLLELQKYGPKILITTLGDKGCCALVDGKARYYPAFKVKVEDTTGAGDVFHGAFLAAYYRGMGLEEAIRYSSAAAAIKCMQVGGRTGIPTDEKIQEFIKENSWLV